ncbi:hypothetical protein MHYP_G00273270 [Metynnis hypsauchen]
MIRCFRQDFILRSMRSHLISVPVCTGEGCTVVDNKGLFFPRRPHSVVRTAVAVYRPVSSPPHKAPGSIILGAKDVRRKEGEVAWKKKKKVASFTSTQQERQSSHFLLGGHTKAGTEGIRNGTMALDSGPCEAAANPAQTGGEKVRERDVTQPRGCTALKGNWHLHLDNSLPRLNLTCRCHPCASQVGRKGSASGAGPLKRLRV